MAVISNRDGGIYAGEHECFQGLVSSQCEHLEFNKISFIEKKIDIVLTRGICILLSICAFALYNCINSILSLGHDHSCDGSTTYYFL